MGFWAKAPFTVNILTYQQEEARLTCLDSLEVNMKSELAEPWTLKDREKQRVHAHTHTCPLAVWHYLMVSSAKSLL